MSELQTASPTPKVPSPAKRVFLSFGSNLGDRVANIRKALERLPGVGVEIKRVSSFYRTEPVEFRPQAWFVNCVAEAETHLMPMQLLKAVKLVERALGRRPRARSTSFTALRSCIGMRWVSASATQFTNHAWGRKSTGSVL